jgi:Protein of unknown function (DUF3617)
MSMRLAASFITILTTALWISPSVADNDLPSFSQGLWSFMSTVSAPGGGRPQTRTVQQCTNPTDDISNKWKALAGKACKFSPITHAGDRYTYTSTCQRPGLTVQTRSSIIVESKDAYRVETESRTNDVARKEIIIAQRVGECTEGTKLPSGASARASSSGH